MQKKEDIDIHTLPPVSGKVPDEHEAQPGVFAPLDVELSWDETRLEFFTILFADILKPPKLNHVHINAKTCVDLHGDPVANDCLHQPQTPIEGQRIKVLLLHYGEYNSTAYHPRDVSLRTVSMVCIAYL